MSNFKATPIKKYKLTLGEVPLKKLTEATSPKLQTTERAAVKEEMSLIWEKRLNQINHEGKLTIKEEEVFEFRNRDTWSQNDRIS